MPLCLVILIKRYMKRLLLPFACIAFFTGSVNAQDELDSLLNAGSPEGGKETVFATFKTTRVVNAQSIETVKKGVLDFRITHRFGNMLIGTGGNSGAHTLWGFDDSRDIRFSFDYGVTQNLTLGFGRSKMNELLDGTVKWRFLEQTVDNSVPVSIGLFLNAGLTPMREEQVYANVELDSTFQKKFAHRMSYTSQLIIARKFGQRFSLEIVPGYTHRNFVKAFANPNDTSAKDVNDIFSVGMALRLKVSKRVAIVADYFYIASAFRRNNPDYFDPIGIGVEIETGGHVFHINLTNAAGINENNFIPYTTDDWLAGGYKMGFNISRVFTFGNKH